MARLDMTKVGVVAVGGVADILVKEMDAKKAVGEEPWAPWLEIAMAGLGYLGYMADIMPDLAEPLAYGFTIPAMNAIYNKVKPKVVAGSFVPAGHGFVPVGNYSMPVPQRMERSYFPAETAPLNR